jgi:hypothetical protein
MKLRRTLLLILMGLLVVVALGSCGGGDGDTTGPGDGDPIGGEDPGGDPNVDPPPGSGGNFLPPQGEYGDLRGVAATREFVYVADEANLYCFDKRGRYINQVAALNEIQGIATFPATLPEEVATGDAYFMANCPAVLHDPVPGWGYVTIYAPGLDPAATRQDDENPDANRAQALPSDGAPVSGAGNLCTESCMRVYDIKIDRYGSPLVVCDIDIPATPTFPDWPRIFQVMNRFDDFVIRREGQLICVEDPPQFSTAIGFHRYDGYAAGDFDFDNGQNDIIPGDWVNLGTFAVDNLLPPQIESSVYNVYMGSASFLRDYVGVASIDVDTAGLFPQYNMSPPVDNGFGFNRIIGGPSGGAPGSFSPFPNPLDPDTTNGGPAGMAVDPRTNELYVCDPGNARVQIFNPDGSLKDIITGLDAPSSVAVDFDGNVFICDVNRVRTIFRTLPDQAFGGIGGTVRNSVINTALSGSVITLRNGDGTIFETEISNINGDYLFQNLPVGNYFLTASKFNYVSDSPEQAIQVRADVTVRADFNLEPLTGATTGQYVGVVSDATTHLPVDNVEVRLVGTSLTAVTDITGAFLIDNIAPGDYQVFFEADGYEVLTKDITILRGATTTDNFVRLTPIL